MLRTDEHPYGLPDLQPSDQQLVLTLMLKFWSLHIMAEEVREAVQTPTQFIMDQPEDPARYRTEQDVADHGYFSTYRTKEWEQFAAKYGMEQVHFDQFPMGHPKRKPILGTNDRDPDQLNDLRGTLPMKPNPSAGSRPYHFNNDVMSQRLGHVGHQD